MVDWIGGRPTKNLYILNKRTCLMVWYGPALTAHLYIGTEGKTGEGIDVRWGRFLRSHLYNIACSINKTVRSFLAFQCARQIGQPCRTDSAGLLVRAVGVFSFLLCLKALRPHMLEHNTLHYTSLSITDTKLTWCLERSNLITLNSVVASAAAKRF